MTVFVALIFLLIVISVALAVLVKRIDRNTVYDAEQLSIPVDRVFQATSVSVC